MPTGTNNVHRTISAAALQSLKQALSVVYWYKNDLRSFLSQVLSDNSVLMRLNWSDYKRNIVGTLVDRLARREHLYQQDLVQLISSVCDINDFTHLKSLEDGDTKAKDAENAVRALRAQFKGHNHIQEETKRMQERKEKYSASLEEIDALRIGLMNIKDLFYSMLKSDSAQKRGYLLESTLKSMFDLFDLDPKASFRTLGEQIDGAFSFDGTDYLLEAKWQEKQVSRAELDGFAAKVARKLDNTLGLFVAINGYSEDGVRVHAAGRSVLILMDGGDLTAVAEGRIELDRLLLRKRRHASQTGNIYLRIHDIFCD